MKVRASTIPEAAWRVNIVNVISENCQSVNLILLSKVRQDVVLLGTQTAIVGRKGKVWFGGSGGQSGRLEANLCSK